MLVIDNNNNINNSKTKFKKKSKFTAILILLLTNQLQVYVRIFDLPETLKKNYLSGKKSLEVLE